MLFIALDAHIKRAAQLQLHTHTHTWTRGVIEIMLFSRVLNKYANFDYNSHYHGFVGVGGIFLFVITSVYPN